MIASHTEEERDLILRLKARDPQALADLYDRYKRMLYGRILRMVGDRSTTEDLIQETMLRIWNGVGIFGENPGGTLATWMGTVARNLSIDCIRSTAAKATISMAMDSIQAEAGVPDFERILETSHRLSALRKGVGRLQPNQRLVLNLSYREGMSHAEISRCIHRRWERLRPGCGPRCALWGRKSKFARDSSSLAYGVTASLPARRPLRWWTCRWSGKPRRRSTHS